MSKLMVGYARLSTGAPDLTSHCDVLTALRIEPDRVYVNCGFTSKNKNLDGLREALAACRAGDTFVVTKLDRLARSARGAHEITEELARRKIKLSIGGSVHDPSDPVDKLLFNVPAMIAKPKAHRGAHQCEVRDAGKHTTAEMAALLFISRSTIYRAVDRGQGKKTSTTAL
ncbi:recombinase family protein [Glutamicibacter sp.]|uniref:recombinase family protein n=1 Tax=Glutamicibacter sp. TaxID=1931995 RepID=UPI002B458D59|nr:recombinase family protein [Glutamicibacter sp.]HJX78705.1 recombinase family protein [Glutamicibacter sp.]